MAIEISHAFLCVKRDQPDCILTAQCPPDGYRKSHDLLNGHESVLMPSMTVEKVHIPRMKTEPVL
ncbi:hypothetical protein OUZ56_028106 [Daphnia magna]|uniref:Uncharacterized protein n=1 Tax=Daphnia magna TaxID=35525 RepID=A0ABR0B2V4_9CRUS|nr:hypothetical protein OUZ56_028106 [Daphnia magna]